jgi:hypothetical protein
MTLDVLHGVYKTPHPEPTELSSHFHDQRPRNPILKGYLLTQFPCLRRLVHIVTWCPSMRIICVRQILVMSHEAGIKQCILTNTRTYKLLVFCYNSEASTSTVKYFHSEIFPAL